MTINLDDYIKAYAYLDIEYMPTAWGVMRGVLVSPSVLENNSNGKGYLSLMAAKLLNNDNHNRLFYESLIEETRALMFPDKASRIRGLYFFENIFDAKKAEEWGGHFIEENLSEILIHKNYMEKFTKVDSKWITNAKFDDYEFIKDRTWMAKYWKGIPYDDNPIWEVILEGVAVIPNEKIRRQAEKNLKTWFPESDFFILASRLASEVGSLGGVITPFLIYSEMENSLKIEYYFRNAELHQDEVIKEMAKHPDFRILAKIMHDSENYRMPDFSPWVKTINTKESHIAGIRSHLNI